jgi:hypothetical protein
VQEFDRDAKMSEKTAPLHLRGQPIETGGETQDWVTYGSSHHPAHSGGTPPRAGGEELLLLFLPAFSRRGGTEGDGVVRKHPC